jgi:hypothetical protein
MIRPNNRAQEANVHHDRFKDAPWYKPNEEIPVVVGGAGGIGSWTSLLLARAGFTPYIYDADIIEPHNMAGQLYPISDIGKYKVDSVNDIIRNFTNTDARPLPIFLEQDSPIADICISGFDNMAARSLLFNKWVERMKNIPESRALGIFIDGRLNAEQMWIYCIVANRGVNEAMRYSKNHLFPDSDIEDAPCTFKQTSHSAAMIASHIVAFLTNHVTNVYAKEEVRTVPFEWEYFIPMNLVNEQQ